MTTERDELTHEVINGSVKTALDGRFVYLDAGSASRIADAILAAGYTKPRQVTTVEELDALPVGSVVLDPIGLSLHKNAFTGWCASNGAKEIEGEFLSEALPATVLYSPAAA